MKLSILLGLSLAAVAPAQTFVVDAANGPGANFTTLVAAVAAVPDGAVLLVRPGAYAGFTLAGKGLVILGAPGVSITSGIALAGTQAHQALVLRQLTWPTAQLASGNLLLSLTGCAGPVLLERLDQPPHQNCLPGSPFGQCNRTTGVYALQCGRLALRDCTLRCTARIEASDAVIESCFLEGEDWFSAFPNQPGRTALTVWNTHAQIAGSSTLRGGAGYPFGLGSIAAGHAVFLYGGSLRVLGGQLIAGANGAIPGFTILSGPAPQLRIAPRVVLSGPGPGPGTDVMPQLTGTSAPPGGNLTATVTTEAGDLVVLVVGLPGAPLVVAGIQDAFWLDPAVHVFHTIAVAPASPPVTGTIAVPNAAGLLGLSLVWQAACLGPLTGFQATNPTVALVR